MKIPRSTTRLLLVTLALAVSGSGAALAAATDLDLDGDGTKESTGKLEVLQPSSPAKVQNKFANRATGNAYKFNWISAGPGSFNSETAVAGASAVGAIWDWKTTRTIYAFRGTHGCADDVCVAEKLDTGDVGPYLQPKGTPAPGRSLTSSSPTLSDESLTASLITFFSPPTELFRVAYSVAQQPPTSPGTCGGFLYCTRVTNLTSDTVEFELSDACGLDEGGDLLTSCWVPLTEEPGYNACVNLRWSDSNCGACGQVCEYPDYCVDGVCTFTGPGLAAGAGGSGAAAQGFPDEVVPLDPGETATSCFVDPRPAIEQDGQAVVCCDASASLCDIPEGTAGCTYTLGSLGTANKLVPDPLFDTSLLQQPYITVKDLLVDDMTSGNGDGQIQSGETVRVYIDLLNAGRPDLENVSVTLADLPEDLDGDGTAEIATVTTATSAYPTLQACGAAASRNLTAFVLTLPPGHPVDTGHPFRLTITGDPAASDAPIPPFTIPTAPDKGGLVMGVSSRGCDRNEPGDFDVLRGFLEPLASLVPQTDAFPLPTPRRPIRQGSTLPMKLVLLCDNVLVTDRNAVDPPSVFAVDGSQDLLELGSQNPCRAVNSGGSNDGCKFRYDRKGKQWIYNFASGPLAPGYHEVTVGMPDGALYEGAFHVSTSAKRFFYRNLQGRIVPVQP